MKRQGKDSSGEKFAKSRSDLGLRETPSNRTQNTRQACSDSDVSNSRPRCPKDSHRYCNESYATPRRICQMRARFLCTPEECLDDISEPSLTATSCFDGLMDTSTKNGEYDCLDDISNPSFLYSPSDGVHDECIEGLSEFLGRTYNELCRRFNNVKDRLYGSPPGRMGPDYRRNVRRECSDNDSDYLFGPSQAHPNYLHTGAKKNSCNNETYEEVIIEKSKLQNGELARTKKRIITKIDKRGNMSGRVIDETASKNDPYNAKSPISSRPNKCEPRRVDFSEQSKNGNAPCNNDTCENLMQESMPEYQSYPASSGYHSNYQRTCPDEQLDDISPAYYDSYPTCCNNETMPSYNAFAGPLNSQTNYPSQMISDISMPPLPDSAQATSSGSPMIRILPRCQCAEGIEPNEFECLEDIISPPYVSTREDLQDVTAPSYAQSPAESPKKVMFWKTQRSQDSMQDQAYNQSYCENLQNVSAPEYNSELMERSSPQRQPQRSMPSECLNNVSAPVFDQSSSRQMPTHQRILSREHLPPNNAASSMKCPTRQWSQRSFGQECLQDISAPEFEQSSSRPNTMHQRSCQIPCPDRNQNPNRQEMYSNECLNDVSMPDFQRSEAYSSTPRSAPRQQLQQQNSPGREYIDNISAPACEQSYSQRFSPNCQQSFPNERLDNISAPTFERSYTSQPSAQRSLPHNCVEKSLPREYIQDVSPPKFEKSYSSRTAAHCQQSFPHECLDNISAPSTFDRSNTYQSSKQRTLPNECLDDVSMPIYDRTAQYASTPICSPESQRQFLDDVSPPTFDKTCSRQDSMRQKRLPEQYLDCNSSQYQRTMPSECLDDQSMPVFNSSSLPYTSTPRRPPRLPQPQRLDRTECLQDISPPTFERSQSRPRGAPSHEQNCSRQVSAHQKTMPSECLENVSQPLFDRSSPGQAAARQRTAPREYQCNESGSRCERTPQRQVLARQITIPSQYLNDVSPPAFDRSTPYRPPPLQRSLPRECLEDESMPMCDSSLRSPTPSPAQQRPQQQRLLPAECSPNKGQSSFDKRDPRAVSRQQTTLPSQRLHNNCAQDFDRSHFRQLSPCQPNVPKECLNDVSMPVCASTPIRPTNQQCQQLQRTLPNENLENISAPAFTESSSNRNHSENLCNVSPPSQLASAGSTIDSQINELVCCLNNVLVSNFGITLLPQIHSASCQERIEDVTAPSFVNQKLPPDISCEMYNGIRSQDCYCRLADTNIEDISPPCTPPSSKSDEDEKSEKTKVTPKRKVKDFFHKKKDNAEKKTDKKKAKTPESSDDGISPPVYPTPGTIKPFQNYQKFMEISKKLNEKPHNSPQTTGDESNLENVTAPDMASTPVSQKEEECRNQTRSSYPPTPGSVQQFRNYRTAVDVTRKKIEKKLPEAKSHGRLMPATPASVQELRNYKSLIELTRRDEKERNQQCDSTEAENSPNVSAANSSKTQHIDQSKLEDLNAPSFPPTPGSIQQLRNYEALIAKKKDKSRNSSPNTSDNPEQEQNGKTMSDKKKDKSPKASPASSDTADKSPNAKYTKKKEKSPNASPRNSDNPDQTKNVKTFFAKKKANPGRPDPAQNTKTNEPAASKKIDKTRTPRPTNTDAPRAARGRSASDPGNRSNQNLRNSRTQTAQSLAKWWEDSDRKQQRSTSTPPQNCVPVYELCNWCREVHYTSSHHCTCSNHRPSPVSNTSNICQNTTEYVYGCCMPCQKCQRYRRC